MANEEAAVVDTIEDFTKMKVVELKKLLKDRGLALSGTKDELIERLRQANEAAEKKLLEDTVEEADESEAAPESIDEDLENEIMNDENKVSSTDVKPGDKRKLAENGNSAAPQDSAQKVGTEENKENKTGGESESTGGDKTTESTEPANKVIKISSITPEQKKELRAKKFGLTEEEKKEARAKRFGITPQVKTNSAKPSLTTVKKSAVVPKESEEMLKKRAERFGLAGDKKLTPEELEKRKKRAERFGINSQEKVEVKK